MNGTMTQHAWRPAPSHGVDLVFRAFSEQDRKGVRRLLSDLPRLYPGGEIWLEARLNEVLSRAAHANVCEIAGTVVGIAIETPKPRLRMKLSTIFVEPAHRRSGIGRTLLDQAYLGWMASGVREAYVTVARSRVPALEALATPYGFRRVAELVDRYGTGRDEIVLACHLTPSPDG